MRKIKTIFENAHAENRAALIAYLPAGFPSLDGSVAIINEMFKNGIDLIEVGVPYSDPLMDGPIIQEAVDIALKNKTGINEVMNVVKKVSQTNKAVLTMSYWSPIERWGVERYVNDFSQAGGIGVITPDLPPDESQKWISETNKLDIERVFVLAPSSSEERIKLVTDNVTGFVYAASLMGVTGTRTEVSNRAHELVTRIRKQTNAPVAVGLGVSNADQAHEVAQFADGVIVGSAFVKLIMDAPDLTKAISAVGQMTKDFARGVRRN